MFEFQSVTENLPEVPTEPFPEIPTKEPGMCLNTQAKAKVAVCITVTNSVFNAIFLTNISPQSCDPDSYHQLIPNKSKKCLIEVLGFSFEENHW